MPVREVAGELYEFVLVLASLLVEDLDETSIHHEG